MINKLSDKIKLSSMKNSFYKLLLIFSVKDIRRSLPKDRELDSLQGMVLVLENEDK